MYRQPGLPPHAARRAAAHAALARQSAELAEWWQPEGHADPLEQLSSLAACPTCPARPASAAGSQQLTVCGACCLTGPAQRVGACLACSASTGQCLSYSVSRAVTCGTGGACSPTETAGKRQAVCRLKQTRCVLMPAMSLLWQGGQVWPVHRPGCVISWCRAACGCQTWAVTGLQ